MAHWGDITARARQIARREREVYQQRELPDLLEEMAAEVERLRGELESARFDLFAEKGRADLLEKAAKDLQAKLAAREQADRELIAVRIERAAQMRKGEAL